MRTDLDHLPAAKSRDRQRGRQVPLERPEGGADACRKRLFAEQHRELTSNRASFMMSHFPSKTLAAGR
jgi:hypothetical protein